MAEAIETSKTRRVYLTLRDRISSGELTPGTRLPSEPDLAELHDVSRVTIRRALAELEREGLISRRPGAGTFITARMIKRPIVADLSNALAHLVEMGRSTDVRLLQFGYVDPSPEVAEALKLDDGEKVQRSVRVRIIDGEPFSYLVTHVPQRIGTTYSEAELGVQPLLTLIERSGVKVDRATQTITATLAGPDVAEALGIDIGAPLLALTRVVSDVKRRGIEHLAAFYRPDRYSFQMDLVRIDSGGDRLWSPVERLRMGVGLNGAAAND
ncbi:GntR family transcriptional regulator [Phreatobacter oligotrophus]|jgi:GntR family transcriptional regulator|uniref:GntR family transcriptional regulator n=1 Tax=Phreatobacter oligotrophus TaxID=1122261 RepID=A0A2T4ZI39_9HYPH|nr:GntR family transcriptional regulator [Phreatobacter oligotrophus]MBX9992163.1 GntR family transcriptional regulator [Phreatobacter oligotrophus]PTM61658.1 GntR family transcriptional regulator [Phreatobacter oligotrophus]